MSFLNSWSPRYPTALTDSPQPWCFIGRYRLKEEWLFFGFIYDTILAVQPAMEMNQCFEITDLAKSWGVSSKSIYKERLKLFTSCANPLKSPTSEARLLLNYKAGKNMIKTLLILWLSGYAIAQGNYEVGTLRILGKNGLATPWSLFISNGKIVADEKMSGFCPDDQGRVLLFAIGKSLVIRDKKTCVDQLIKGNWSGEIQQ